MDKSVESKLPTGGAAEPVNYIVDLQTRIRAHRNKLGYCQCDIDADITTAVLFGEIIGLLESLECVDENQA